MEDEKTAIVKKIADPVYFRRAISRFPTGVTVVTCLDAQGNPHGITANSFTSVSLEPPTVLVSIKSGYANTLISAYQHYAVNILSANDEAISHHFARNMNCRNVPIFEFHHGIPVLLCSISWFICKVYKAVDVCDHTLFIGEVIECDYQAAESPLVFFNSNYYHFLSKKS
jgi:styrene monooxygenase reductase component